MPTSARINDPAAVARDYEHEDRFLARRLATWARLEGPLVEDLAIAEMAALTPTVLVEVGCGTGDVTERVQREVGAHVLGVDLSPRMAERTGARGIPAMVADIQTLPFADGIADCVLANRVLYHLPDPAIGAREIARVLRPGGRLVAISYSSNHCSELYDLVGPRPDPVADGVDEAIEATLTVVERRQITGTAVFPTRDAVLGALGSWGAYAWYDGIDLDGRVPDVDLPFTATYRHSLLIATSPTDGATRPSRHRSARGGGPRGRCDARTR